MPGTRMAPTVNGTPLYKHITIRLIDQRGNLRADAVQVPNTVTDAEIEAYIAAYQVLSNASIYEVQVSDIYKGEKDAGNAATAERGSVNDVINVLLHDQAAWPAVAQTGTLRAPIDTLFVAESDDVILPGDTPFVTWHTALRNLINGGALGSGAYSLSGFRFSERKGMSNRFQDS